jgi:hypothetical protein
LGHLACDRPEENARRRASEANAYARLWLVLSIRLMRHAKEEIVDAKEKSPKAAGPIVDTAVLLAHNRDFFVDTRVPMQHAEDASVHTPNAVPYAAVVRVHNEGAVLHAQDLVVHAKERFVHAGKRVHHAKGPGVHNEDLRMDKKICVHDNDVFVQDDPAASMRRR